MAFNPVAVQDQHESSSVESQNDNPCLKHRFGQGFDDHLIAVACNHMQPA
jgi:hypothetical protein